MIGAGLWTPIFTATQLTQYSYTANTYSMKCINLSPHEVIFPLQKLLHKDLVASGRVVRKYTGAESFNNKVPPASAVGSRLAGMNIVLDRM